MMQRMVLVFVLSAIFAAGSVNADALGDLKTAIGQLKGTEPVKGTVSIDRTNRSGDDDDAKDEHAQISFAFSTGPQAVSLTYPTNLLQKVDTEKRAQSVNPEATTPFSNTLRSVDPVDIYELLDFGPVLRRLLDRATLVSATPTTVGGKPGRVIVLRVTPLLSKSQSKRVKKVDLSLKIMAGEDNVPVAAELSSYIKASVMLMSIEQKENTGWTLGRRGDRLLAIRRQSQKSGSGLGQSSSGKTIMTIALE